MRKYNIKDTRSSEQFLIPIVETEAISIPLTDKYVDHLDKQLRIKGTVPLNDPFICFANHSCPQKN
jgi:hypothetical protein